MKKKYFKILIFIIFLVFIFLVSFSIYTFTSNRLNINEKEKTLESNIEENEAQFENVNENINTNIEDNLKNKIYESDKSKNYLALGDSITLGTGLKDKDKNSFSSLLSNNFTLILNDAIDGMSCSWLSHKFKQGDYKEEIKKADIVTLSIGSNDLLGVFYKVLAESFNIDLENNSNLIQCAKEKFNSASLEEKYTMIHNLYSKMSEDETKKQITEALNRYKKCWPEVINHIKSLNKDAEIIAIEYYNPYHNIHIPILRDALFSTYFDSYVEDLNKYLHENVSLGYKVANIKNDFYLSNSTNVNISPFEFNLDPHPNEIGHRIIYEKIMEIINSK